VQFLLIIPVFFVLAHLWLAWSARARRAPEIEATIAAHRKLAAAMAPEPAVKRRDRASAGH
jgi:hypothetical protein